MINSSPNKFLLDDSSLQQTDELEEQLFHQQKQERQTTIRNNIFLVTLCNIVCIVGNTFAITFYKWYKIDVDIKTTAEDEGHVWLNLLYLYDSNIETYMSFNQYLGLAKNICSIQTNSSLKGYCYHSMRTLSVIGIVCFIFILSSLMLQIYDIFRLRRVLLSVQRASAIKNKIKGSLVYALIIITQIGALLSYFIAVLILDVIGISGKQFGISYWVSFCCSILMILFASYYKWSKGRYRRFLIMDQLLDQELAQQD